MPLYKPMDKIVEQVCTTLLPHGFDTTYNPDLCTLKYIRLHYANTGRVIVWLGGSDKTIFGKERINHMFRAWHDYVHITCNLNFTTKDELAVMRHQIDACWKLLGEYSEFELILIQKLIEAEIQGQRAYYNRHKRYVKDQRRFTLNYLRESCIHNPLINKGNYHD